MSVSSNNAIDVAYRVGAAAGNRTYWPNLVLTDDTEFKDLLLQEKDVGKLRHASVTRLLKSVRALTLRWRITSDWGLSQRPIKNGTVAFSVTRLTCAFANVQQRKITPRQWNSREPCERSQINNFGEYDD